MRALLAAMLLVACTPRAMTMSPEHPANPSAPVGRTAGAPAALRPGVATLDDPPPSPTEGPPASSDMPAGMDHSQHGSPPSGGAKPSTPDKADSIKNMPGEPSRVDPEKAKPSDDKTKKPAPKPQTKKPTKQPAPAKEPAKQPAPAKPPEPAKPPVDHSGGH